MKRDSLGRTHEHGAGSYSCPLCEDVMPNDVPPGLPEEFREDWQTIQKVCDPKAFYSADDLAKENPEFLSEFLVRWRAALVELSRLRQENERLAKEKQALYDTMQLGLKHLQAVIAAKDAALAPFAALAEGLTNPDDWPIYGRGTADKLNVITCGDCRKARAAREKG